MSNVQPEPRGANRDRPGVAYTMKVSWKTLTMACALIGAAHAATAEGLAAYPAQAQLDHGADAQRIVLVQTRPDGVTLDVTAQATVTFDNPAAVTWGEDKRLRPTADGETIAHFSVDGVTVDVPVKVANVGAIPPKTFRNDVQPALMRAGCNSGACHGSARGKNGFGLSLFGYDDMKDYATLTRDQASRRINIAIPSESLALLKPMGVVPHDGGTVMQKDDLVYTTILKWIEEGAKSDPAELPHLTGIEILPHEAVLEGEGAPQRFVVNAKYSDGTDRDVTDMSILSSSDEATLKVAPDGMATSGGKGEIYIMARYGSFAVVSKAIVVAAGQQLQWPEDAVARNYVDEYVFAKLKKLRIPPAVTCDDSTFIRRVYLDIIGQLPTPEEAQSFMADTAPDKRNQLIDKLLQRPEFADVWAMKWADVLKVQQVANILDRKGVNRYNDWIRNAITTNVPVDQMVRQILTAEGGNFTNPATNFYVLDTDPLLMAENVAQVFFGIKLQCAQCHNHPFERWTMDDYYSFAAFFGQVGRKASSDPRETVIFNRASGEVPNLRNGAQMAPKFLGGDTPDCNGKDRRAVLAEWLTAKDNPWFAKNVANRVWQQFYGKGIVDPPDDVRVSNPPSNPQLLDELGKRLVEYEYDLRKLVRDITTSYTYQLSTQPREPGITDSRNFAMAQVRRMGAETMLDAISRVTESQVKFPGLPLGASASQVAEGNSGVYFLSVFGRPSRASVCTCERKDNPTLAQSLHLINGDTIDTAVKKPGGRLDKLLAASTPPDQIIHQLYMAAFARTPSPEEFEKINAYVTAAADQRAALEDTFWSLLNSKEFMFNH